MKMCSPHADHTPIQQQVYPLFTIDEDCSQFTSQLTKIARNAESICKEAQNAQWKRRPHANPAACILANAVVALL
jgi:hypothetical protein